MKHPEIQFEDYNVAVKEMNLVSGGDIGNEAADVRYFGTVHTLSVGSEITLSKTDDDKHILEPANPPRKNDDGLHDRVVLDVSNKPKEIVLSEDTSTSDNVSKIAYGGSTKGPTSSSTSGLADQGKSMESASVSVEVNSYDFLPEMNYPLR